VALKDLVSDLSNFNGRSQYDGLDGQIENGVDYFPDDTSGAKGFTPSTDLLTKYNKFMKDVRQSNTLPNQYDEQANISARNAGVRINTNKLRLAYGTQGEYSEAEGVGISKTSHMLSIDNQLGIKVQPKFTSDFMTTPLADYVSNYNPPVSDSLTLTVSKQDGSGNWTFDDTQQIPKAITTPFNNQVKFTSRYEGEDVGAGSLTLTLPKEAFRKSSEMLANVDTFRSIFSVDTIKSIYNDSSDIEDLFKFKDGFGRDTFKNVPAGMNENGNFGTTDFRTIANKGPFKGNTTHPIILRKPGSNWDNVLNESIIGGAAGDVVAGALGVVGLLTRTSRDLADKSRIFRFMISSKGISFVAKQFAFQALNPTLESKIYNPLSTLGIAGLSDLLSGDVGGLLRAASSFLFPTHVERHLPNPLMGGASRYEEALELTGGRLEFQSKAFGGLPPLNIPILPDGLKTGNSAVDNFTQEKLREIAVKGYNAVSSATSGIKFVGVNPNKYLFPISSAPKSVEGGRPVFIGGPELAPADTLKAIEKYKLGQTQGGVTFNKQVTIMEEGRTPTSKVKTHIVDNYSILMNKAEGRQDGHEKYFSRRNRKASKINRDIGLQKDGNGSVDKINMIPYKNDYGDLKDFIKFRFYDITNDRFIIFRAILEAITDTVTPNYSEENYIGRPDKVFVYQNVDRSISFTFSIYPKTKKEFPVLMEKLNYLVGLCYPTFSQTERMQAPFMQLTMGDMFADTPGILTGLTVTVEEASTWEIEDGLQFPHFIKAACEFRHIGSHIPDARGKHYDLGADKGFNKFGFDTPFGVDSRRNSETTQQ